MAIMKKKLVVELLTDLRWSVCALTSTIDAAEDWAIGQLRPNGLAERYYIRKATWEEEQAAEDGLLPVIPE